MLDERHLLLLGILLAQSQHGYQINEFIEANLGRVSRMRRATAYSLLERLKDQGLVTMRLEAPGNHPPRKVYTITPAGREKFLELLRALLVRVDATPSAADIAMMFIDYIPVEKTVSLLGERLNGLRSQIEHLRSTPSHTTVPGVDYAIQRKIAILQAEQSWLEEILQALTAKKAGEHRPGHGANRKVDGG